MIESEAPDATLRVNSPHHLVHFFNIHNKNVANTYDTSSDSSAVIEFEDLFLFFFHKSACSGTSQSIWLRLLSLLSGNSKREIVFRVAGTWPYFPPPLPLCYTFTSALLYGSYPEFSSGHSETIANQPHGQQRMIRPRQK